MAGVGGGVLEFVEYIEGTDRAGALGWLCQRGLLTGGRQAAEWIGR